ncbi:MAG: STAS domain-containing protein [Alphaproteobacteria bacterium]|nr:STAS domain-containing protein [Alphaproteobacteria bacterium]
MDYSINNSGNRTTINMSGRLTFDDQGNFKQLLKELADDGAEKWLLDISGLEYIDSAGLGLMLRAQSVAEKAGKSMSMRVPQSGQVAEILEIAQFQTLIPTE